MSTAPIRMAKESVCRPVAVVDIGATSIRMAIAEIDEQGQVNTLENLSQAVTLGKDTFTKGLITKTSIEDSVRVLRSYSRLMREYGIVRADQMRVVATSAVREANNRLAFLDRVYVATGLEVEPLDEAEVNRMAYMGIQPQLQADPQLASCPVLMVEFGGGSTEVLVVHAGDVLFSHTYRLGSLRLLEMMEQVDATPGKRRQILETQIQRQVAHIREDVQLDTSLQMVAMGGDVRFAANHLLDQWDVQVLAYLPVKRLKEFTHRLTQLSDDEIAQRYGISYQDAETVVPALLCYVLLARCLGQEVIAVSDTNLRDGLLQSMAIGDSWTEDYRRQAIRSASSLSELYGIDEKHSRHVAQLSAKIFADLQNEHQLEPRMSLILYLAAMLYDVGSYINSRSAHKHSMYIIRNSELFGLSRKDVLLISLVARYHRRSSPQPQHEGYSTLDRRERVAISKLSAILRLAIALDDSRSQRINDIRCRIVGKQLVITAVGVEDVALEQMAFRERGGLFEEVFGVQCQLRAARA
ncbi:MAG: Ppx/GppA family phosphatase [Pirellulaceae bacterium]|nr:Ppx/GppA family phosphatase [Pirellulaceae bacterium]